MRSKIILGGILFTFLFTLSLSAQDNFKIVSYNVLKGLQGDSVIQKKYVEWVKEIDPDIVAYQEMNNFTSKSIEDFAARYGHPYAVISKTEGFPVALSSKYPIVNVQKVVDNMWHAYLYANINNIHVFVIHFSPFSYRKRQFEVKEILARAALIPKNEKIIIMGDFNSLSSDDAAMYTNEFILDQKKREEKQSHIRNLNNGGLDYTVTNAMKEAGYTDALRIFHSGFQKSCPTEKYTSKFPKRIDYIWVNPSLSKNLKSTDIIYDEITHNISDHYPLIAKFKLK